MPGLSNSPNSLRLSIYQLTKNNNMKNYQKGFAPIIIALIVAVVLGGGYLVYKNKKAEAPTPVADTSVATDTSNWKTYTNTKYGFTFNYTDSGYPVEVIDDITKASEADGACSTESTQTFQEAKIFAESNIPGKETDKLKILLGLHKIYKTASGINALVSIQTCQGEAEDNNPADSFINARIFKGNTLVTVTEGQLKFNGNVKVKDINSVAQNLLDGTYKGPEQELFNQFIKTISTFKFTPTSATATSDWKTYTNEKYGFNFQYPQNYSVTIPPQSSDFPAAVDISYLDPQRGTSASQLMRVLVDSTSKPSSFEGYLKMRPLRDANSGTEYLFKNFIQRKIGDNVFYSILTERFEGTLAFSYYTIIDKKVFIFLIQSQGVAWTDPKLDTENDTYHVIFRKILSTFKFTTPSITVLSPNGGETFKQNSPITVKWSQNFSAYASICLMGDAGCVYNSTPVLFNSGVNIWTIPANTKITTCTEFPSYRCYIADGYKVRVTTDNQPGSGHAGEFMNDQSDNYFTILSN
jgi:hypothetical protein